MVSSFTFEISMLKSPAIKCYHIHLRLDCSLINCTLSRLRALPITDTRLTRLRALPNNNMHLMRLYAHAPLPLSIGALRPFVLTCVALLLLKGRICFACALQLTIQPPSLSSLLFYHIKLFCMLFSCLLF